MSRCAKRSKEKDLNGQPATGTSFAANETNFHADTHTDRKKPQEVTRPKKNALSQNVKQHVAYNSCSGISINNPCMGFVFIFVHDLDTVGGILCFKALSTSFRKKAAF